jgi:hypothetical protein
MNPVDQVKGKMVFLLILVWIFAWNPVRANSNHEDSNTAKVPEFVEHLVQEGETLWFISQLYYGAGAHFDEILVANNLQEVSQVKVGQKLRVPFPEYLPEQADWSERYAQLIDKRKKQEALDGKSEIAERSLKQSAQPARIEEQNRFPSAEVIGTRANQQKSSPVPVSQSVVVPLVIQNSEPSVPITEVQTVTIQAD